MNRREVLFGLAAMLAAAAIPAQSAEPALERYCAWLHFVDDQRVALAESTTSASRMEGDAAERRKRIERARKGLNVFVGNLRRTMPPIPDSCLELDRLYFAALKQGQANVEAAVRYGLNYRDYSKDQRVMDGIKGEKRGLETAAKEFSRLRPGAKSSISTTTFLPDEPLR